METYGSFNVAVSGSTTMILLLLSWWLWKFLNWAWLKPKKLEKCLREQGLNGNPYRLLFGDTKEMSMKLEETMSKPINLTDPIISRLMPFFCQTIESRGKNCFVWLGPIPAVILSDPEQVKEVLTKHSTFQKPPSNPLTRLLTMGLASLEEEKWAKHRKIMNPAFHAEKLKLMTPAFYTSCYEMLSKWDDLVASTTNGSCELDVWPDLETMTSDVISRTVFSSNFEEGRKIFELQAEQAKHFEQVMQQLYLPGWCYVPTQRNKRMKEIHKEVRKLVLGLITNRLREMEAGEAQNNDLLGILLESNLNEIQQQHGDKKIGMSLEDIIEECKFFYIAGQETTSDLLVWTLITLSQHLDWQARARDEVLLAFGQNKPDTDGLNRLKIVTMILNEVLRLYPPVVMLPRVVRKDTKLKELSLPAGVMVLASPILLHQDEEIWGKDAKEFNPERFSEGVASATQGQMSFFPFSWGPRICLGQNFAMLEAKMALALILQRFSFELSPTYAHAPQITITLKPQFGAQLIMRKL